MITANALSTVAVRDMQASCRFYTEVFDREPDRDADGVREWQFPHGGSLQLMRDPDHAGHCSVPVVVTDAGDYASRLTEAGYVAERRGPRTTLTTDPDGNQIALVEPMVGRA